jgi:hypothetical protein
LDAKELAQELRLSDPQAAMLDLIRDIAGIQMLAGG